MGNVGTGFTDDEIDEAAEAAEAAASARRALRRGAEDAEGAQGRRRLGRAEARRRGGVRRVDARRPPARALATRGCARTRRRSRFTARSRSEPRSARASACCGSATSTSRSGPRRGSPRATCSATTATVAPVLVPHLKDRPFTMKRYPDGWHGQVLLPEGRAHAHARVDQAGRDRRQHARVAAPATEDPGAGRQRRAVAALDDEHGLHRLQHVVLADRQARPARLGALRPRSVAGRRLRRDGARWRC